MRGRGERDREKQTCGVSENHCLDVEFVVKLIGNKRAPAVLADALRQVGQSNGGAVLVQRQGDRVGVVRKRVAAVVMFGWARGRQKRRQRRGRSG
jgi:hypothetical protein